jgi:imidazolonepropionase-like amidohydrolase
VVAARLLRLETEIGTLEAGRAADIIAVEGDPLKDITTLERVSFVLKGGKVIRQAP